jgi:hypothetical protein
MRGEGKGCRERVDEKALNEFWRREQWVSAQEKEGE